MKEEVLMSLGPDELDAYAQICGIDVSKLKGSKAKARLIAKRRQRVATVSVLGIELEVPVAVFHDKRITDRINNGTKSDAETEQLMIDIVGQDQWTEVVERCTEEDGSVDLEAIGLACATIIRSEELKNF